MFVGALTRFATVQQTVLDVSIRPARPHPADEERAQIVPGEGHNNLLGCFNSRAGGPT